MTTESEGASRRGLLSVLAATAVAGISGYLIQLLAARLLPDVHAYLSFSVFWSTLYLIGSAVGGIQQEVARAAHPAESPTGRAGLGGFIAVAITLVVAVSVLASFAVAPVAFAGSTVGMMAALAIGLAGYVVTAVLTGLFYGLQRLGSVAALIVVDAVLRTVAVLVAFVFSAPPDVVAMAIALPFGLAVAVVWLIVRRRVVGRYELDVSPRQLSRGAAHTVVAAAATGLMVTGMPLLFRLGLADAAAEAVAALTLVVTLTRAPFIIPLMALQSYLTVSYRDAAPDHARSQMWRYLVVAAVGAAVAAVLSWFAVPGLIGLVSGGQYRTSSLTSALVVVSAVMVGCMCITGPALLAQARHRAFAAGWVVAAGVTVVALFLLPSDAESRALGALVLGPATGLLVHILALRRGAPARGGSVADGE